MESDPVFFRV